MSIATTPVSEWSRRLAEALVSSGRLDADAARAALARSAASGTPVAILLAHDGIVDSAEALECLSAISGLRAVDLDRDPPTLAAAAAVPLAVARYHRAIGQRLEDGYLVLACSEPLAADHLQSIASALDCGIAGCVLADPVVIDRLIAHGGSPTSARMSDEEDSVKLLTRAAPREVQPPAASAPYGGSLEDGSAANGRGAEKDSPSTRVVLDLGPAPVPDRSAPSGPAPSDRRPGPFGRPFASDVNDLLVFAVEHGASDLHLAARFAPAVRIDGSIRPIEDLEPIEPLVLRDMIFQILPQSVRERYEASKELDTSYEIPDVGRFRLSVFQQRGSVGAVFRTIPPGVPTLESLDLPRAVSSFADLRRGLVLLTGPTGSGKSTTLAAVVDRINATKPLHIMTVEDPIEFHHEHKRSIVNQREVGQDTSSFAECLRHVLRQDPDVILVGEMRDLETISTALTAAETGHLVFATLHTQDAPQTIDRIVDVFPTNQQDQVRVQLAGALEAVVTQQLVIAEGGVGRVPVAEVMVCTPAIRNLIRSSKTHQIYSLMQTGGSSGMQTMDQALAEAVRDRKISETVAFDRAHDPKQLLDYLKG
ncbi:MAG TPA: PilT/PilU family type 4a pilus ATPase [Acidimicrobiales bacterium]|nr:PilT/PilU family type 4a pilus ATPase [Acidimicrobiales bacterium]